MFLQSINYFRGIAILFVVSGHVYFISGCLPSSVLGLMVINIIQGGTHLFLFISGFLFEHIIIKRFDYFKFMVGKVKNVLLPYIFLSFPIILIALYQKEPYTELIFTGEPGIYHELIRPAIKYFLTGRMLTAYWYTPFIMVVFALSPLCVKFSKLNFINQKILICIAFSISIFLHRSLHNMSLMQDLIYFLPVYFFGILVSQNYKKVVLLLSGKEFILFAVVIGVSGIQAYSSEIVGNYHKHPFEYNGLDFQIVQKMFLCLFFLTFLSRFENTKFKLLELIASSSFAIYFLHPWVIYVIKRLYLNDFLVLDDRLYFVFLSTLVVFLSFFIAKLIKSIAPSHSRKIIGW